MRIFDICGTVVYLLLFHRCFFDGTKETRHGNCGCGGVKKSHYWRQDHGKKEWYEQRNQQRHEERNQQRQPTGVSERLPTGQKLWQRRGPGQGS